MVQSVVRLAIMSSSKQKRFAALKQTGARAIVTSPAPSHLPRGKLELGLGATPSSTLSSPLLTASLEFAE